ncbi:MAG: cyclic nucleotide-binding domain-containing protein [Deltaproteobacteria bacterium]|nr:cyclic nucleotide-binding domain-containing protein [Deltaproteobacteria bacterium]
MPDIRELKDQAAKQFTKGRFEKAAAAYQELCRLEPKDAQLRVRLGDALVKKGDRTGAVTAYRVAAEAYAKDGLLPRAIAVCKLILEVDPEHVDTQNVLAELYARKSGGVRKPASAPSLGPAPAKAAPIPPPQREPPLPVRPAVAPLVALNAAAKVPELELDVELEDSDRKLQVGVVAPSQPLPGLATPAHAEMEPETGASGPSWKGSAVAWEPPAPATPANTASSSPSPKLLLPNPTSCPPPPPDDVMFDLEPEAAMPGLPGATTADSVCLTELDLGEPELLGLHEPEGPPASGAPAAAISAPAGPVGAPTAVEPRGLPSEPVVADSLAAALETAVRGAAEVSSAKSAAGSAAPAQSGAWFAAPDGTSEEPGRRRQTLADLEITSVNEDEEMEVFSITVDPSVDATRLPEIPLFSDLSREAFVELASHCQLRRCAPGEVVIAQGSIGTSFFVVTGGAVRVVRRSVSSEEVVLARLGEGSFFGEMALLSGTPRAASVVAEEDTDCLEISAELLGSLSRRYPHVQQALKKFCRQRLLANVLATSSLFKPFDKNERKALVEKFKARELAAGEIVVAEGQPADGLYVIMAGEVEVRKKREGQEVRLAALREGEVFGEISLLTKSAATATVAAVRRSTILRLPRPAFDELISTHPQILMLVSELSDERLRAQQSLEQGQSADGLLLL